MFLSYVLGNARSQRTAMQRYAVLCLLLISPFLSAQSASNSKPEPIWITDVFIISPENLDHIEKGSVLIEDGRIAKVERNTAAKPPAGAAIIAGKGQYLIPGLIDSHVHLASVPGMVEPYPSQAMIKAYFDQLPRSYLYYGYTTLVDLVVTEPRVLENFRNAPLHPDLYDCGGALAFANGYPMSFAPPATRFKPFPNFIYDPKQADKIPSEYKPEDHTPAADVEKVKKSGAICVKTFFERGFANDKNLPVMSAETMSEIRNAATAAGLVLMIHANGFEAQKFAEEGNADVIVHGMWNWGKLDPSPEVPDEIKQVLDQIVEKRIGYQPTLQVLYGEEAYFDHSYLKMPAIRKVIPAEMLNWFQSPEGQSFGKEVNFEHASDEVMVKMIEDDWLGRVRRATAYLASKNANFLFGTDTPSAPTYGNLPGLNGYLEMHQLQRAGLSLAQIFKAATISNAREFKMESQIGSIEPGKIANLVLMKKSPLESVDAYDTITTVWVHGREIRRESLAAGAH
jgi:imidazolonepropionase-like amidohydrolase